MPLLKVKTIFFLQFLTFCGKYMSIGVEPPLGEIAKMFFIFCTSSKLRKNQGAERWKVFYSLIFIYTVKNPPVSEYSSESVRSVRKMRENIIGEKIRQWVRWHSATSLHRVNISQLQALLRLQFNTTDPQWSFPLETGRVSTRRISS